MPQRSNEFQGLVKFLYEAIAPTGAKITESAMLKERGNDTKREVDVLIEHEIAGHSVRIAVECRDRTRQETIEWVDHLVGKYADLPVDRIVAITPEGFSQAARDKAGAHRIELVTAQDARAINWSDALVKPWKGMTNSFILMRIVVEDLEGAVISWTDVDQDGVTTSHRDQRSADLYPGLRQLFFDQIAAGVARQLNDKIAQDWQNYIDDPKPRWAEIIMNPAPGANIEFPDKVFPIGRVVFGIGTLFHVTTHQPTGYVLKDHLVQQISSEVYNKQVSLRWILNSAGELVRMQFTPPERPKDSALMGPPEAKPYNMTPILPPEVQDDLVCEVRGTDNVLVHLVRSGKSIGHLKATEAQLGALAASLLMAARMSSSVRASPAPSRLGGDFEGVITSPTRLGLVTHPQPGHEILVVQVGEAEVGFAVPHAILRELGNSMIAASAATHRPK